VLLVKRMMLLESKDGHIEDVAPARRQFNFDFSQWQACWMGYKLKAAYWLAQLADLKWGICRLARRSCARRRRRRCDSSSGNMK
jgi:hypothetical protein